MATQDQMSDDERAYAAAFGEDMAAAPQQADDESFGIMPPGEDAPSASDGDAGGEPAAVTTSAEADAGGEAPAGDEPAAAGEADLADEDLPTDPKELQRLKSWEGRVRAREAQLAEREAKLAKADMPRAEEPGEGAKSEAMEQAAETLAAEGDDAGAEKVEQVAEQVESGDLTAEQAMKILAEDFGPEFVKMIEVIAGSKAQAAASKVAQDATGQLSQSVQEIIDTIVDDKARSHFEAIANKHPDFVDVAATPEFEEFKKSYPDGEKIASEGSAKDIVKMLDEFKAGKQAPAADVPDPAVDAAEGVRSSGMRLPEAPTKAEGYEDAWSQF